MNPSATNALFVCCLLLVLFFIVGMMLAAVALLSQSNFKNTRDADPNTVQAIEKTVNARAPSILTYLPTYLLTYLRTYLLTDLLTYFNHVACSKALQPTAQLDARSVALHFSP